jgi:hypothetical protein
MHTSHALHDDAQTDRLDMDRNTSRAKIPARA